MLVVVGQLYQLVMVWGQVLVKECCHLPSPYAAAGEYWVLTEGVPNRNVPGMVGLAQNTPGLARDTPGLAQGGDTLVLGEYLLWHRCWVVVEWSG